MTSGGSQAAPRRIKGSLINSPSQVSEPTPAKRSPWVVVGSGIILFVALFAALMIVSIFTGSGKPPLPSYTLADGRIVVVEQVTFDPQQNFQITVPPRFPPWMSWWEGSTAPSPRTFRRDSVGLTLLLSSRDPAATAPDDFSWWTGSAYVDSAGNELQGRYRRRFAFTDNWESSLRVDDGEFPPITGPPAKRVAVSFLLPMVRKEGETMTIRLFGPNHEPAGDLHVPWPAGYPESFPVWTADPLPIETPVESLVVRLDWQHASRFRKREDHSGFVEWQKSIFPKFIILRDGVPVPDWHVRNVLYRDAMGNECSADNFTLPKNENVWELDGDLFRTATAEFSDAETVVRTVALPEPGAARNINEQLEPENGTVTLVGAYGPGLHEVAGAVVVGSNSLKMQLEDGGGTVSVTTRVDPVQFMIDAPRPFLLFREDELPERGLLSFHFTDAEGQNVRHLDLPVGGHRICILDAAASSLPELRVRIAIQKPLPFTTRVPAAEFPPLPTEEP